MDRLTVLRAYVRLVEKGSFTAVAEELQVKQSTVSKWLLALEDELGVQLLDRTTRSQRTTDAGQRFYDRALGILSGYDSAVAELKEGDDILRGRIRMSLPVVFGRLYVVPQVTRFLKKHKDLELQMVLGDHYVSLVDEGYDLAVRVGAQVDSSLRSHYLGDSARRLVASPGYIKAHGQPDSPKELERHECLLHNDLGGRTVWSFSDGDKRYRISVRGRVAANNSEATAAMARSGLGICLLADWLVDADLRSGRLVQLLPELTPPSAPIRALTPPGRHTPPRVRALIEHLRDNMQAEGTVKREL